MLVSLGFFLGVASLLLGKYRSAYQDLDVKKGGALALICVWYLILLLLEEYPAFQIDLVFSRANYIIVTELKFLKVH